MAIVCRVGDRPGEAPGGTRVGAQTMGEALAPFHSAFRERVACVLAATRRVRRRRVQQEIAVVRAELAEARAAGLPDELHVLLGFFVLLAKTFYVLATATLPPPPTCAPRLLARLVPAHGPPTGPAPVLFAAGVIA